ncbi:MAG: matrixin family metalloprotease [Myxococcota bacterium]
MSWLLMAAGPAWAYSFTTDEGGDPLRWTRFPVTYATAPAGEDPVPPGALEEAVDGAYASWARVDGAAVRFRSVRPGGGAPEVSPEAPNGVWFVHDWPYDPELLALTSAWAGTDGAIVAYDVQVNADVAWSTDGAADAFDLQAAITHEVGHVLGLWHSDVAQAAMFATATPGEAWRRVLDDDDREAVRVLYPPQPGEADGDGPLAALGCDTSRGALRFWALGLVVLWRRRP